MTNPPVVIEDHNADRVKWFLSFGGSNPTPDECIELSKDQCFWIESKVMNICPSLLAHAKKLSILQTRQGRMSPQELQEIECSYVKAVEDAQAYHRVGGWE